MTASRPRVLLLGDIEHAQEEWQGLADEFGVINPADLDRQQFLEQCHAGGFDDVIAILRTFDSVKRLGPFDRELIQALPESLKFVCHNGAGYDQVDVSACTDRGIRVSNTPSVVDDATADTNMFLILGALRGFNSGMMALRERQWRGKPLPALGHDLEGKLLGILGMGGIGRNLRDKAQAFRMRVQYFNRNRLSPELERGAEYVDFDHLIQTSDVISLNLPLKESTRRIISTNEFAKMKPGVVIVNTARGAVIDEAALVEALDSGHVFSCGLDVYENEPDIHPGLVENARVMLLPHLGTWTFETQRAMEICAIENVRGALNRGRLNNAVIEQAHLP